MLLADALAAEIRSPSPALRAATDRLRDIYRSGAPPQKLALATEADALAYAAYRMPATYAAARAALSLAAAGLPTPRAHLDLGGGTGALVWAVADHWSTAGTTTPGASTPGPAPAPSPSPIPAPASTVLDASRAALRVGAVLGRHGPEPVQQTRWVAEQFTSATTLPAADLVTMNYLLGELDDPTSDRLLDEALRVGEVVLVLEPGTPRGFAAICRARERLLAASWDLVAPCPHALTCPITGTDWCHFSARLPRSSVHRALKTADRGFEDEKFSFVVARRPDIPGPARATARVVRHPSQRKGLVLLRTCESDGLLHDRLVSKRHPEAFRAARQVSWGDPYPTG